MKRVRSLVERAPDRDAPAAAPVASASYPAEDVKPGDLVRVRDAEYIRRTLDARGKYRGCSFARGMWKYCGRELRVVRRVDRFFDESQWRMLRARNMVLLDGAFCGGEQLADGPCDRMCFFFWRTEWLEKVG